MAVFPDADLQLILRAAFGADLTQPPGSWVWTDLSDRVLPDEITATSGTAVGAVASQVSSAQVTCRNDDGALTPFRATSPWWPNVDAGTPIWLQAAVEPEAATVSDTFGRTVSSGWGTATTGEAWTASGGSASDFNVASGAGTISLGSVGVSRRVLLPSQYRDADVVYDTSVPAVATGGPIYTGVATRYTAPANHIWASTEFNPGGTVSIGVRVYTGGPENRIALAVVPGLTYTVGTVIRTRVQVSGTRVSVKAWLAAGTEPDTWHTEVHTDYPGTGLVGIRDTLSSINSNSLPVTTTHDNVTVTAPVADLFAGYLANVRPTFLPEGGGKTWSQVVLDIQGVGSRIERQGAPAYSPMRRSVQFAEDLPISYWPLEDTAGSKSAASAYPDQPPMVVEGPAVFGATLSIGESEEFLTRYGTRSLVSLATGGRLTGQVAAPVTNTDQWAVFLSCYSYAPETVGPIDLVIAEWLTPGGTFVRWDFAQLGASDGYRVRGFAEDGTATTVLTSTPAFISFNTYTINCHQVGGSIEVQMWINGNLLDSDTVAGVCAPIGQVTLNPNRSNVSAATDLDARTFQVAHLRLTDAYDAVDIPRYTDTDLGILRADRAWTGEKAHARIARLCAEERVPIYVFGNADVTGYTQLGSQPDGSFSELVNDAAESESGGLLFEHGFGYAYRPRTSRYNPPVALEVDLGVYARSAGDAADQVLVPELSGQGANVWTVERTNGSSAIYAAPEAYRKRRGTIADQRTIGVLTDGVLRDHAAFRTHLSTAVEAKYPALPIDLAANPDLIPGWLTCLPGSRVRRTGQPDVAGHGVIDQILDGYTQILGPRTWKVAANGTPARVWDFGAIAAETGDTGAAVARWAADDAVLDQAVTDSATTLRVRPGGTRFTTNADDLDPDLKLTVGGEELLVSAVADSAAFVAAGTAAHASNTSVSPGLPAGAVAGDVLLVLAAIRNSGTGVPNTPTGYTRLAAFPSNANVQLFAKIHSGSESAPTVSFAGGAANATTSAQMAAFRGLVSDTAGLVTFADAQLNGSAQNIDYPYAALKTFDDVVVLWLGWKADDDTGVASPGTEIGDLTSTLGDDQSLVWSYQIQTFHTPVDAGTFTVTGGASAISRGAVVALQGVQTMTVSQRSTNGVVKAHEAGAAVEVTDALVATL